MTTLSSPGIRWRGPHGRIRRSTANAAWLYAALAMAVLIVIGASARWLPSYHHALVVTPGRASWRDVWANWDGGWYREIARSGYGYARGRQLSVAFFPAYPAFTRLGAFVTGDFVVAGVGVTVVTGLATALVFFAWLRDRLSGPASVAALLALLLFPYAFYLYGPMYADALFVACAIGAFLALERGHPLAAGLLGIVASAARPIGVVLVVGLVARALELTADADAGTFPVGGRRRRATTVAAVAISALGVAGYCAYLWRAGGNPLAFVSAEHGWNQAPALPTWLKTAFFAHLGRARSPWTVARLCAHPIVAAACLLSIPRVVRRFGRAYGLYATLAVLVPVIATKDFFGVGRYALAAFPCFAAAGEVVAARPMAGRVALICSGVLMLVLASQFGRGAYVA